MDSVAGVDAFYECATSLSQDMVCGFPVCVYLSDLRRTELTEALISANTSCGTFTVHLDFVHVLRTA